MGASPQVKGSWSTQADVSITSGSAWRDGEDITNREELIIVENNGDIRELSPEEQEKVNRRQDPDAVC